MRNSICILALGAAVVTYVACLTHAADKSQTFLKLPQRDGIDYLKKSLLDYRQRSGNLSATVTHSIKNLEYDPEAERIGSTVLQQGGQAKYDLRRIDDSYRVSVAWHSVAKPGKSPSSVEGYDAAIGECRMIDPTSGQGPLNFGRISRSRGHIATDCFLYQYLGDDSQHFLDFGSLFLKRLNQAKVEKIDAQGGMVEVSFPLAGVAETGRARVRFDLKHDAIPVGFQKEITITSQKGAARTFKYDFSFSDLNDVAGVWIPTTMYGTVHSSSSPKQITIHEGRVEDIEVGRLVPDDLQVTFDPGTKVHDERDGHGGE